MLCPIAFAFLAFASVMTSKPIAFEFSPLACALKPNAVAFLLLAWEWAPIAIELTVSLSFDEGLWDLSTSARASANFILSNAAVADATLNLFSAEPSFFKLSWAVSKDFSALACNPFKRVISVSKAAFSAVFNPPEIAPLPIAIESLFTAWESTPIAVA